MQLIPDFTLDGSASAALCFRCRCPKKDGDAGVLSTGMVGEVWRDGFGVPGEDRIELCRACVEEMASIFGMVSVEKAEGLRRNNRQFGLDIGKLKRQLAAYEQISGLVESLSA